MGLRVAPAMNVPCSCTETRVWMEVSYGHHGKTIQGSGSLYQAFSQPQLQNAFFHLEVKWHLRKKMCCYLLMYCMRL